MRGVTLRGKKEEKKGQTFPTQKHTHEIVLYLFSIHAHKTHTHTHTERERGPLLSPPFERI